MRQLKDGEYELLHDSHGRTLGACELLRQAMILFKRSPSTINLSHLNNCTETVIESLEHHKHLANTIGGYKND